MHDLSKRWLPQRRSRRLGILDSMIRRKRMKMKGRRKMATTMSTMMGKTPWKLIAVTALHHLENANGEEVMGVG